MLFRLFCSLQLYYFIFSSRDPGESIPGRILGRIGISRIFSGSVRRLGIGREFSGNLYEIYVYNT